VRFMCIVLCLLVTATGGSSAQTTKPSYTPMPTTRPDGAPATESAAIHVEPIPDALRHEYRIDPFYTKCCVIDGIPIMSSDKTSDYALLECAWTLDHLLNGRAM